MIECTVGVMAYNEAGNIEAHVRQMLAQDLEQVAIGRVVVVASGCTDGTDEIAAGLADEDPRVKLIVQPERRGKASAINLFLPHAEGDVAVLASADILPEPDAIEQLVRPFADSVVGMTGSRPIPTNDPSTFWGHAAHMLWGMHHDIALQHPKLGEMVAFRNVVRDIPEDTAVDEASIQAQITEHGLEMRYAPESVVHNRGPDTLGDFLRQRRRIHAGHLHLSATTSYRVPTMSTGRILKVLVRRLTLNPKRLLYTGIVVGLEALARALGLWDHRIRKRNPYVWDMASTTKVPELKRLGDECP